ncbi:tyrosine specific protein phosphatase and dual specificity protein phosphatase [Holotrichia oblita]|uniref:Tyrosine specific protein phosphatase and dual specificity protein phosphatase n=1 Tax=Holotrichia oblita TaxID=644536 RepID=A0ACB9TMH9_HOLOL|nr:tyrosine specific protein phosphatase and dual specificity protein phosphatase [Holotrichia oblita]
MAARTCRNFNETYPQLPPMTENKLRRYLANFLTTASVKIKKATSAPVTGNEDNEVSVLAYFEAFPRASTRAAEHDLGIPRSSIHRIMRNHKLHNFKFVTVHALQPTDRLLRVQLREMLMVAQQEDVNFLQKIIWTDESKFSHEAKFIYFRNFVDASQGISNYTIRLIDCLQAIEKAKTFNFFNFNDFNVLEYDTYDKIQNGDMNWLVPRKFLAFIGPTECEFMNGHPPEFYVKYFLRNDVKTVIRLNNKMYDAAIFTDAGIDHRELFFADGTTPPKHILMRFLDICEKSPAAIGVHCKAGLGRTGSLIGAYIIKHYRMSARESIAWMRICRPGSVIGQQQGWLEKVENWLWRQGSEYRLQHFDDGDKIPHHRYGVYSKEWPIERRRLILQAQKTLDCQDSHFARVKTNSPQRLSAPPIKPITIHKSKRPESEKRRICSEREYQKVAKMLMKPYNTPIINDENQFSTKNIKFVEPMYYNINISNKLKELGNVEHNMKKTRDRIETDKTQGDRLNEIKIRKQSSSFDTKTRSASKHKPRKDCLLDIRERNSIRGDSTLIYNTQNSSPPYYLTDTHENSERSKKKYESENRKLVKHNLH